ncbi:MAG: hypothetical protein JRF33_18230 [Deltaproteobacteria bacterium]|nr:hypothetical protein [Deltaproteobacteria bacterium]
MKKSIISTMALFLACAALTFTIACDSGSSGSDRPADCYGKCDGPPTGYVSPYEADLAKVMQIWPGPQIDSIEQAYTVQVDLGEIKFGAPTHLFGVPVNIIPYSNDDGVTDAEGGAFPLGDQEIAQLFPPGQVGYAIKHHRPQYRTLNVAGMEDDMKEHMKLQDTHIEIVVGVWRDSQHGAITINNPQGYEDGLFGTAHYPMIFVKPVFPEYLSGAQLTSFMDNIRTMVVGFNSVSNFPGDYNGGDPLAANSPDKVREHVDMMVRSIAGDTLARDFFLDPANEIYCAELAHVATSAGMLMPLNAGTMVPRVGQDTWDLFIAELEKHNAGDSSTFTELNDNGRVALVELSLAPEDLLPAPDYAPADIQAAERQKLAFQPMTMADIVASFMRTHVPREQLGEQMAPVQGMLLEKMKPGLLEAMAMDQIPAEDPRRQAIDGLFAQLVSVVSTPYDNYAAFQTALAPLMDQARMMTGPRDDTGKGLFVPPSLLHIIAQGKHNGGMIGLLYVGHGLHVSACKKKAVPTDLDIDPVVEPDEPFGSSCAASCGGFSPDLECACDEVCEGYGDCCDDYAESCL